MLYKIDCNFQTLLNNFDIMKQTSETIPNTIKHTEFFLKEIKLIREKIELSDNLIVKKNQNKLSPFIFDSMSIISSFNTKIFGVPPITYEK